MTNEEKLKHFETVVLGIAQEEASQTSKEYQEKKKMAAEAYSSQKKRMAENRIRTETANLERAYKRDLAEEHQQMKKQYQIRKKEMKDQITAAVIEKLKKYCETDAYEKMLEDRIGQLQKAAGGREMTVILSSRDRQYAETLQKKTGAAIEVSQDAFLGGVKALLKNGTMMIDETFETRLEEFGDIIVLEGGEAHE